MTEALQIFLFAWISGSFIICFSFVVWPMILEAFRKPVRHEAVILQFRPRTGKGHFHE